MITQPLRDALVSIEEYWNGSENQTAMSDAVYEMRERAREALALLPAIDREIEAGQARYERLEVQLAGCGVAALGWSKGEQIAGPSDWGWSPSYEDTVKLRRAFERLANGKSPDQVLYEQNASTEQAN